MNIKNTCVFVLGFAAFGCASNAGTSEVDELQQSLQGGSSIAEVAETQGVDVQTVIDALVAAAQAELDERVAAGDLDEERATEIEAELVERITAKVNGEFPARPGRPGDAPRTGETPEDESAS